MKQLIINQTDAHRIMDRIRNAKSQSSAIVNTAKLMAEINKGKQVPPEKVPATVVTMHSKVRVRYLDTNQTVDMELVYPEEADIKNHRISIFAPMATALLGFSEGDEIEWTVPAGTKRMIIEKILYQPESNGYYNS